MVINLTGGEAEVGSPMGADLTRKDRGKISYGCRFDWRRSRHDLLWVPIRSEEIEVGSHVGVILT